jgi:tripartite-type tricarboxylate transporter receptor subunit TctC
MYKQLLRPLLVLTSCLSLAWSNAIAQQDVYPSRKPIVLVSPYPAGGASDVLTRILGASMSKTLGQTVTVQNQTGAGGTIGSRLVANAAPDGYTLLLHHFAMATGPYLYKDLQFDPLKSFEHIGLFAETAFVLVSGKQFPPNTMSEVVDYIKLNKEKVTFATGGIGSGGHLFGIILEQLLGNKFTSVHYRGAAPAMVDVLGGRVDLLCDSPGPIKPHLQTGALKAFALTGPNRLAGLPNIPTVAEARHKELTMSLWYGLYAPRGTPKPIVDRISQALQTAMKDPAIAAQLEKIDTAVLAPDQGTPAALYKRLAAEMAQWGPVIAKAGVVPE